VEHLGGRRWSTSASAPGAAGGILQGHGRSGGGRRTTGDGVTVPGQTTHDGEHEVTAEDLAALTPTPMPRPHPASILPEPLRIAVLTGGANTERNVSLSSGTAVVRALRGLGHAVAQVDSASPPIVPDQDPMDAFLTSEVDEQDLADHPIAPTATLPPALDALAQVRSHQRDGVLADGLLPILQAADVVVITVFGDEGESGATQRLLDAHGIAYTGPSAEVCEVTFDKARTKEVLAAHGIDTPEWHVVHRDERFDDDLAALTVVGPWIVKPVAGGSTIGLSYVEDEGELVDACARATAEGQHALIETFVPGRDLTIGALGERVFAVVEALTDRDLYDYEAKYTPGQSNKRVPAHLTDEETAEVQRLTAEVHRLLDIGDTSSRADFRITDDGLITFFETNPLPGLTPTSSYPISAAAEGVMFPQLCEELVLRALRRHGIDPSDPGGPRPDPTTPVSDPAVTLTDPNAADANHAPTRTTS
jgi:D-alanine-D-alanine ligase